MTAYVQKSADVNIETKIVKSGENTYTVTVTPSEEVSAGKYTLFVHETNNTNVNAQAILNIAEAGAKVTIGDTTTYYANIKDAFANTLPGGSVVTALKSDKNYPIDINFNTTGEGVTFDLNGCNFFGIVGTIQSGAILKVVNDKDNDPGAHAGSIHVNSGGTLIFSPEASTTFVQVYNNGGNITLSGGCFYICNGSQNKPITEYLKEGYAYAYKKPNGALMEYAEARKTTTYSSGDLYAVECNHSDYVTNDSGKAKCKYCNADVSVEWKSGDTTRYFKDLKTALTDSAVTSGTSGTLKLLEDDNNTDTTISSGNFDLDLNGKTITYFNINNNAVNNPTKVNIINTAETAGNITHLHVSSENTNVALGKGTKYKNIVIDTAIGSMLTSDVAMKIGGTYATEAQLNSSGIFSDAEIVEAPLKITAQPSTTDVSEVVYSGQTSPMKFNFEAKDSNSRKNIKINWYIEGNQINIPAKEVEIPSTQTEFDMTNMVNEYSAGKYKLILSASYDGYTMPSRTYDFNIVKSTPTILSWGEYPDGKSYTGSAIADPQSSDITVGNGGSFKDITFEWYKANKNGDNYTKVGEKLSSNPVNAGDYIVEAVFKETDKTNAVTISKGITINKKDYATNNNEPITESFDVYVTSFEQTYRVDLKNVLEKNNISGITENDVFTANTKYGFVNLEGQIISAGIVADENKLEIVMDYLSTGSQKTVGTVEICFSSTNYNSIKIKFVLHSVNKPERNLDVTMDNWTYGDTAKTPVYTLPEENPKLKTVSYAKKNGTVLNAVPTDAGEYTVTVKAEYDDYVYTGSADFTIIPKDISNDDVNVKVTLDHNTFEYDGTQKKVNIVSVVVDGEPLELGKDYGISSISGADAGTYVIKITGNGYDHFTKKYVGNYVGQYTVNWTITPKPVTPSVEVTGTYTYTGSEIKPTIVVKDGETVIPESEYEVSCKNNINAGTGRIIITDKDGGNYIVNGGEEEFTIEKAEVTIKALDKNRRRGGGMLDIPATLAEGEDYTVTGLIGDDKLGGTISISFAETEDSSKYDINITADGINENYTPVYEKGTLNIYKNGTDESDPSYTGGSSSGGSSSSSSSKNDVTVDSKTENGKITIDKNSASKGSTVTITVTPDEGYEVDEIKVTDESGNEIKVTDKGNGKYTFTMPATDADIKADFKETTSDSETEPIVITMQIGNTDVSVNEKTIKNDVAPVIRNSRTLVPIRIVTEPLGGKVDWNNATKEVTLNIDGKEIKMTIGVILEKYGVAPTIINDRTYVPIRFVADELGADVQWNEETKTVTIIKQ